MESLKIYLIFIEKYHHALLKSGIKKNEPTESGTSAADVVKFSRRKMHKDMNDIEGDDSPEEEEDSNEVDKEKDTQSDDTECDDASSGDDEEDNDQVDARKSKPAKYMSKPSHFDQMPND